jgi:hypothetical protein
MEKHLISSCVKIPSEEREEVALVHKSTVEARAVVRPLSNSDDSTKISDKSILAFYQPAKLSKEAEYELNLDLLRAMISGGVAFKFSDNFYCRQYVRKLRPGYVTPS